MGAQMLTLGRMASVESLISGKSAASRAAVMARDESRLTLTDREALASGRWADDVSRITHGRLFYVDLPKAIAARAASRKKSGGSLSKDARESLKTDAAILLVQWADARESRRWQGETLQDGKLVCKLGGAGNLPYKRDWLDPKGGEGVSDPAWNAMNVALSAAERADSEYAARKREQRARTNWEAASISTDSLLADGMDGLTAAEKASLVNDIDTYRRAWRDRETLVLAASASEIAGLLGLSQTAARYMQSRLLEMDGKVAQAARPAYPGRPARVINGQEIEKARPAEPAKRAQPAKAGKLNRAACAHQWDVPMTSVKDICTRGKAELKRKYPTSTELVQALRAAARAMPEIAEDAARESILDYLARPDDSPMPAYGPRNRLAADADLAAREYLSVSRAMPAEHRAIFVASVKYVSAERADVLAESIPRQIAAEDKRQWNNLRAGLRDVLAGKRDSASDSPLYIGSRAWKNTGEDSEMRTNRERVEAIHSERFRRYIIARACAHSLAACLVAISLRETARQRAHDRQVQLAIEQALDGSNSYQFHPMPNAYGRAYLAADGRALADVEKRMDAARKVRLEDAREVRVSRKRARQSDAATSAREAS